jgi:hypothetical protein
VHKERFRKYTLDDGVIFEPSASQLQKALEGVVVAISATLGAVPRLITEPRFAHFWVTTGGKPAYTQLTALVRERGWVRVGEYLSDVKKYTPPVGAKRTLRSPRCASASRRTR